MLNAVVLTRESPYRPIKEGDLMKGNRSGIYVFVLECLDGGMFEGVVVYPVGDLGVTRDCWSRSEFTICPPGTKIVLEVAHE